MIESSVFSQVAFYVQVLPALPLVVAIIYNGVNCDHNFETSRGLPRYFFLYAICSGGLAGVPLLNIFLMVWHIKIALRIYAIKSRERHDEEKGLDDEDDLSTENIPASAQSLRAINRTTEILTERHQRRRNSEVSYKDLDRPFLDDEDDEDYDPVNLKRLKEQRERQRRNRLRK